MSEASLELEDEYDAPASPESELPSIGGRGVGDAEEVGTAVAMHSTGIVRHNRVSDVVIVQN